MVPWWRINCFLKVEQLKKPSFGGRKLVVESCSFSFLQDWSSFTFFHIYALSPFCTLRLFCAHLYLHLVNTISFDICCFNVRIAMLREVAVVCLFWYYESYSWRQLARPPQQHTDYGKYHKFELTNIKQLSYKSWTITRPPQQHTDYIQIWN